MTKIRLLMNGVAPISLPVSASRSGAPDGSDSSRTTTTTATSAKRANLSPRASATLSRSSASTRAASLLPTSGVQAPSRGSTMRAVIHAATTASTIVETTAK